MAKAGPPVAPKVAALAAADPLLRMKRAKLRQALGLEPAEGEDVILAKFPRPKSFTPEEVISLLGDGERGIPRMLPVDVALGRLGMPIVRLGPDGTPERLVREFPKAWAARQRSDRAIAAYVARTFREVPRGFYIDRERLLMSLAEAPDDEVRAAGAAGYAVAAEIATEFRFDLVPDEMRLAGYQMWQRRRLAGIAPFSGAGLVFGLWDDVMSPYDVPAPCWRGFAAGRLAADVALARELSVAMFLAWVEDRELDVPPWGSGHADWVLGASFADPIGPGVPDRRSFGAGLAALYRAEAARPGPTWSARPVPDRPEGEFDFATCEVRHQPDPSVCGGAWAKPEGYEPGKLIPHSELGWTEHFVSA